MQKKRKKQKKPNIFSRIFRFFIPKDWGAELKKGMMIGEQMKRGNISPKVVPSWWLGKGARKLIDPKRKINLKKEEK